MLGSTVLIQRVERMTFRGSAYRHSDVAAWVEKQRWNKVPSASHFRRLSSPDNGAKIMNVIENIEAQESGLREIYQAVFDVLNNVDSTKLNDYQKERLPLLEKSIEKPKAISLDKLVAVLDALSRGELEVFYPLPGPYGPVGDMARRKRNELGLRPGELENFLSAKGLQRGDVLGI